jgi:bacteriocin biosynthesis cyclodehydratase domain-containing protein
MAHLRGTLEHCGLLTRDAGDGGGLRERHVCVLGRGPLPDLVREQLGRCGVGQVSASWSETASPDLVVLVTAHAVAPQEAPLWLARGLAHLPVIAHSRSSLVGPVVRPHQGPCLHCLDLHRRDRDGAWPRLLAQLAPTATDLADPVDNDPALAGATAAVCAMVVRGHITGAATPPGTTWEVSLPWGEVTGRSWPAHPACPCQEQVT